MVYSVMYDSSFKGAVCDRRVIPYCGESIMLCKKDFIVRVGGEVTFTISVVVKWVTESLSVCVEDGLESVIYLVWDYPMFLYVRVFYLVSKEKVKNCFWERCNRFLFMFFVVCVYVE